LSYLKKPAKGRVTEAARTSFSANLTTTKLMHDVILYWREQHDSQNFVRPKIDYSI